MNIPFAKKKKLSAGEVFAESGDSGAIALQQAKARLIFVFAVLMLGYLAVSLRLVDLSLLRAPEEKKSAATEEVKTLTAEKPLRGTITDRNGELIATYLAALAEAGVERDAEEFTRHYRIALAHCLIYGVTSFQSYEALPENSRQMMRTMLDRSVRSIVDMESLALLP